MNEENRAMHQTTLFDSGGGNRPVVRAMSANVYLFAGMGFIVIEVFLRIAHSANLVLDLIVIFMAAFFLREYIISVARIIISESAMTIVLPLHQVTFAREKIESMELNRLHISNIASVKIHGQEKGKKRVFHLRWYKWKEDLEILKSSWLSEICTLDGESVESQCSTH